MFSLTSLLSNPVMLLVALPLIWVVKAWAEQVLRYGPQVILQEKIIREWSNDPAEPVLILKGRQAGLFWFILSLFDWGKKFTLQITRREVRFHFRWQTGKKSASLDYFHSIPLQQRPSVRGDYLSPSILLMIFITLSLFIFILTRIFSADWVGLALGVILAGILALLYFLSRSVAVAIEGHTKIAFRVKQGLLGADMVWVKDTVEMVNQIRDVIMAATMPVTVSGAPGTATMPVYQKPAQELNVEPAQPQYVEEPEVAPPQPEDGPMTYERQVQELLTGLQVLAEQGLKREAFHFSLRTIRKGYHWTSAVQFADQVEQQYSNRLNDHPMDRTVESQEIYSLFARVHEEARQYPQEAMPESVMRNAIKILVKCYPETAMGQWAKEWLRDNPD